VIVAKTRREEEQTMVMGRNLSLATVWSTLRWTTLCACVWYRFTVCLCLMPKHHWRRNPYRTYFAPMTNSIWQRWSWETNTGRGSLEIRTFYGTGAQIFEKFRSHFEMLGARRLTWSKLRSVNPQILGVTVQNLVATVSKYPAFVPLFHRARRFITVLHAAGA
jgi:hypothetical protein